MANQVMTLDERVGRLEETVTTGFAQVREESGDMKKRMRGLEGRMSNLEDGMRALGNKIDVLAESLRGDIHIVLERVVGFADEMRRTSASIRQEHEADRRIIHLALENHGTRIASLERDRDNGGALTT